MAHCIEAMVVFSLCIICYAMATNQLVQDLENRIKACEFIKNKMRKSELSGNYMPMPPFDQLAQSNGAASSSNQWPYHYHQQQSVAEPWNMLQNPAFLPMAQNFGSNQRHNPQQRQPNLATIYGGELLRTLRQNLQPDPQNDGGAQKRKKFLKKAFNSVKIEFIKKYKLDQYADKALSRQDKCFQKLATEADFENQQLIITLRINEHKDLEEFKNILTHGGGFIDRIVYYSENNLTKLNDKFFEQLFIGIMNEKFTIYQRENDEHMMMMQQSGMMNNGGTMGNAFANYGMTVGHFLGNMMEHVVEYGKNIASTMNNNNNNNNNNGNNNFGAFPAAGMHNGGGMPPGMEYTNINDMLVNPPTTEYTFQTPSRMIEDIGIAVYGIEKWNKKLLAKVFVEQVFEAMRYIKGSENRIPYWEAMLGLSPVTKAILQFCKSSSAMGHGIKFRARVKRLPNNSWQHLQITMSDLFSKLTGSDQICF